MALRLLLLIVASLGCGGNEAAESERETPATVEATMEEAAMVEASAMAAEVDHGSLRSNIAAARRVAGRDAEAGYRAFVELIEEHPAQARLYCEAGFLAHRADKHDEAATLIQRGLQRFGNTLAVPAALRNPVAMCLYNQGLVAEARGRVDEARRAYHRSLALRPNATVERRLALLVEPPPELIAVHDHDALGAALMERLRADPSAALSLVDPDYSISVRELGRVELGDEQPDVAVLQIDLQYEQSGVPVVDTSIETAVISDAGYRLFPIFDDVDRGQDPSELTEVGNVSIDAVVTGAGPVVRVTLPTTVGDQSESCTDTCCYEWTSNVEREIVALCTVDGPACRHFDLSSTQRVLETVVDCDEDEEASEMPERTAQTWRRSLTIDADRTTHLTVESGQPPTRPAPGDRPLAELLNLL